MPFVIFTLDRNKRIVPAVVRRGFVPVILNSPHPIANMILPGSTKKDKVMLTASKLLVQTFSPAVTSVVRMLDGRDLTIAGDTDLSTKVHLNGSLRRLLLGGLGALFTGPVFAQELTNNVALTGLTGAVGSSTYYSVAVPTGATNLQIRTSGGTGDADLYVSFGIQPTTSSYGCNSSGSGNAETCTFSTPNSGVYQILLKAYSTYSGASLSASYTAPVTAKPANAALKEYRYKDGSYFYSALPSEQQVLESGQLGPEWVATGNSYTVWADAQSAPAGSYPTCRFRGDGTTVPGYAHFYTAVPSECAALKAGQVPYWIYEGVGFFVHLPTSVGCPSDSVAMYRQYNESLHNHHFQTGNQLSSALASAKWSMEGVPFCVGAVYSTAPPPTEKTTTAPTSGISVLAGVDSYVRTVASNNSCGYGSRTISGATAEVEVYGSSLILRISAPTVSTMTFGLRYISGNSSSGFQFNGTLEGGGVTGTVNSATLRNSATSGLQLSGNMRLSASGCTFDFSIE